MRKIDLGDILLIVCAICIVASVSMSINSCEREADNYSEYEKHLKEKEELQKEVKHLQEKIHDYELEILKTHLRVDDYSNDELDSVWTNIFGQRNHP